MLCKILVVDIAAFRGVDAHILALAVHLLESLPKYVLMLQHTHLLEHVDISLVVLCIFDQLVNHGKRLCVRGLREVG